MYHISLKINWFKGYKKKKIKETFGHTSLSLGLKGSLHEHCKKVLTAWAKCSVKLQPGRGQTIWGDTSGSQQRSV